MRNDFYCSPPLYLAACGKCIMGVMHNVGENLVKISDFS